MNANELQGRTALVTGASSGLGLEFARELAARGARLVLVARREDRLRALARELERDYNAAVQVLPFDLCRSDAADALATAIESRGLAIDILVNNAGFGLYGDFDAIDPAREREMLELNVLTLTALTHRFAPVMKSRGWGRILLVSSLGAYQPSPTYAAYAATKSYVLMYGHAINNELRGSGVSCTVVSPGITATEFLAVSGQQPTFYQRTLMMQPADVARVAVRALLRRRAEIVPGWLNAASAFATRLVPRTLAAAITRQLMT